MSRDKEAMPMGLRPDPFRHDIHKIIRIPESRTCSNRQPWDRIKDYQIMSGGKPEFFRFYSRSG